MANGSSETNDHEEMGSLVGGQRREMGEKEMEIEELGESQRWSNSSVTGGNEGGSGEDVYVAVGKSSSSMAALDWALKNVARPQSFVYLIHVFPEVHRIPTPLGMVPKNQVRPDQVESYMIQERIKRNELLQKFLNRCAEAKVNADTFLIESDTIAKAVLDLIPILHIQNLVVGCKSDSRKMNRNETAEAIQRDAPKYCKVNVVCNGKELGTNPSASPVPAATTTSANNDAEEDNHDERKGPSLSCSCFSAKFT